MRTQFLSIVITAALLGACTPEANPKIQFMGVSPGGMQTTLEELEFGESFPATIKEFVAVISLEGAVDGTSVEATWFSPDERRMPLGRTAVITQSGATIARFTLATTEDWERAPYKMLVDVKSPDNFITTSTGSIQFFIGMTDRQIEAYKEEWTAYEKARMEELNKVETGTGVINVDDVH